MDVEVEVEVDVDVDVEVDVDVDVLVDVVVVLVDVVVVEVRVVRRPAGRVVVAFMSAGSSGRLGRNGVRPFAEEVLVVGTNLLVVAVRKRPGSGVSWS